MNNILPKQVKQSETLHYLDRGKIVIVKKLDFDLFMVILRASQSNYFYHVVRFITQFDYELNNNIFSD